MNTTTEPKEKRTTLVHDRFQACCHTCGFLSGHLTKQGAITAALSHDCEKTEVWDAMARHKDRDIVWRREAA